MPSSVAAACSDIGLLSFIYVLFPSTRSR
jgi:hypothetical protein